MDTPIQLKLKKGVYIQEFDTSSKKQKYIISYNKKNWIVDYEIYNILLLIDGKNSKDDIVDKFNIIVNSKITLNELEIVIKKFLIDKGLLEGTEDFISKKNNLSYLWFRVKLLKSKHVQKLKFLSFLYYKNLKYIIFTISMILNVYVLIKNINMDVIMHALSLQDISIVYILMILFVITFFHEVGHMAACMSYDIIPGDIGFAFYFINPVLFSNVNNAWRLKRKQRVIVDLGGIYFQNILISITTILGIVFKNNVFIASSIIGTMSMLNNFNPFLKMDGYWMISDILGISNLKKVSTEFVSSKIYRLFGVEKINPLEDIKKKEKSIFVIYSIISNLFIIVFMYSMIVLFFKSLTHLSLISGAFSFKIYGVTYTDKAMYVIKKIINVFGKAITLILLGRVTFTILKGVAISIIRIAKNLIKARNYTNKLKNNICGRGGVEK